MKMIHIIASKLAIACIFLVGLVNCMPSERTEQQSIGAKFYECEQLAFDYRRNDDDMTTKHYFAYRPMREHLKGLFSSSFYLPLCNVTKQLQECLKDVINKTEAKGYSTIFYFEYADAIDSCEWVLPNENLRQCLNKIHDDNIDKCHPGCKMTGMNAQELSQAADYGRITPEAMATQTYKQLCSYKQCFTNCAKNNPEISCDNNVTGGKQKYVSFLENRSTNENAIFKWAIGTAFSHLTVADEGCDVIKKP